MDYENEVQPRPSGSPLKPHRGRPKYAVGMTHPNVGLRDVILEAQPGGGFRLTDPASHRPVGQIVFHNRKAARNWAHGRGLRLLDDHASDSTRGFPAPTR